MVSTSVCAKADEVDLVGHLSLVIGVGDEEDTVAELVEWPRLKSSRVEFPTGSSRFREFCKAKSSIDGIWGHTFEYRVILVCETLNERWAASGSERRITAKDFLEYYAVKYVTATDGAYLSSSSSRPYFFDLFLAGRVWNDNLLWVFGKCLQWSDEDPLELNNRTITKGINCKVSRKESFIDAVAREGTELEAVPKELEISWFKRVASKDDRVRRSQAKRRMAAKTLGSMEEKLSTPKLNTPLKLPQLNEMPNGLVDMATISNTVVWNLAKRKAVKRGDASRYVTLDSADDSSKKRKVTSPTKSQVVLEESDKIAEGANLRPRFEVEVGLLEEQCLAKAREKMVAVMDDEFKKDRSIELEKRISQLEGEKNQLEENLTREREAFQLELEKEREAAATKLKEVRVESMAEAERLVTASATSRNNLAGKFYQLRYTKAEIMTFSKGNYEENEIMDEDEVEEIEDGLNVAEKTIADNQETINQAKEKLAVLSLQMKLNVARERERERTLLYNAEYVEEYEALISQYEDRLDDNVKLTLKLEEAKRQVEDKTATILSKDSALNQLTSELIELREKAASGSRHEVELTEYHIRALNEEISNMKCNIRALNEQLLKREFDLDTARTNLAVFEANFKKLSSSIVGKVRELRNSTQIRDSLISRLDHLKADLRRLKEREAQSRVHLIEIQAKNKSLVNDLAHAYGNVRRVVQREKEMNERINQLCTRISESERELRVREMKYQKDLKFKLDKRDGEIASGEGSREIKEFLHQKEELVENMRIDLTNSRQKSIDLTRQMSERIDQLIAELAESKAHRWKDNKRADVTHQAFKELVVHEQEKCDGKSLHQRQLSALVTFFVEEIKLLQVERNLMQDCFFGRTCVCKLDISSIDPIGVMDHGIGTTTTEQIARGREIVAEQAPEYMASRTKIGGSSSAVSPTPVMGGRSTALPSRKSSRVKKK
ncbi:hypothetical protein GIB67_009808 [Kingdonia uniflora]|uniref:Uncharacterized protein n=1 Tax=Kingdonia uniflora TaxID=39325 RepID=A0A7J7MHA2_9MAGN|nr:hypothetical protein GIB67_009808 [Kingdonia uniflora]